jgi:hypothetical protein
MKATVAPTEGGWNADEFKVARARARLSMPALKKRLEREYEVPVRSLAWYYAYLEEPGAPGPREIEFVRAISKCLTVKQATLCRSKKQRTKSQDSK